jgi:4-diphosphocytidyl-2-C-methyl-D-erythritol kinase
VDDKSLDSCRSAQASTIHIKSPAKINLGLRIVGRRADGFHSLESLFWPIDFCDDIFLKKSSRNSVETFWGPAAPFCDQPLPSAQNNLVTRVLKFLPEPDAAGLTILIRKQIPLGSGLGGGSSNAGTVLRHFRRSPYHVPYTNEQISKLGADIPFFLDAVPSWVTGIGERCEPLGTDLSFGEGIHFLLILFPQSIDTREIFLAFQTRHPDLESVRAAAKPSIDTLGEFKNFLRHTRNDLEPIVTESYPLIGETIRLLKKEPSLYSGLSGSGATCFAVYDESEALENGAKALAEFCRINNCRMVKTKGFRPTD